MVALGRTLIADPDFCSKVKQGDIENIRMCLSCQHCIETIDQDLSLRCTVNPEAGREYEFLDIEKADVQKKLVVIGGGNTGCETAEYFANQRVEIKIIRAKDFSGELEYTRQVHEDVVSKDVTIVEMLDDVGKDIGGMHKAVMDINLKENGIRILSNTKVLGIQDGSVAVENIKTGEKAEIFADTVVLAGGLVCRQGIPGTVAKEVLFAGDCRQPGKIVEAIYRAYYLTRRI